MTNTTFKPLPIILDRLAHALEAQGIKVKRSQLLEISAAAFGHRNSNELTAAAKAGDINPYPAQVIGRVELPDGQRVIIVNDQLANSPYAIDEVFLEQVAAEERREEIGITPYGHLAALYEVLDAADIPAIAGGPVTSEVHVGRVSHKHGENIYVAADDNGLTMQVAEYVRENWHEVADFAESGEVPEAMTDAEVVEAYFDLCQSHEIEEYLDTSVEEIAARILPVAQETPVTPRRYGLQYEMDGEPIFIVDRHVKDKDDEYATVAEMPRTSDPQSDIALAQKIVDGLNGDSVPAVAPGNLLVSDLLSLADDLVTGAEADVWYDAHEYMDEDDEEDEDTIKWHQICNTQLAMAKAATILRNLASRDQSPRQVSIHTDRSKEGVTTRPVVDDVLERQESDPVWITDSDGRDNMQVTASHMTALGLEFYQDYVDTLPLTEDEYEVLLGGETLNKDSAYIVECGFSVLYKGKKWLAPEIGFDFDSENEAARAKALEKAKAWIEEKREEIERVGGHIILTEDATDNEHEVTVLLPFQLAIEAETIDDWRDALAWLMRPKAERTGPRVKCDFLAQTWMKDWAMAVDPNGDTSWDATFDAVRWGEDAAKRMLDSDMDEFAIEGATAPEWIRQWTRSNPFEVMVTGLEELFGIDE